MKTMKYISLRVLAIAALALAFAMPAKAQLSDNGYANVDWQFNAPLKNHFADKASGWGMNFEGGYFVTPNESWRSMATLFRCQAGCQLCESTF